MQISTSALRIRRCVEPIRSVETRSGHTRVTTSLRAAPAINSTAKAAAAKVPNAQLLTTALNRREKFGAKNIHAFQRNCVGTFFFLARIMHMLITFENAEGYATGLVRLSVCLSVCEQDNSKRSGLITIKFTGSINYGRGEG